MIAVITISNASIRRCRGVAYGSTFGGMRLRGVFWGSVGLFKENLKNWQGNFSKIATNFCEKRKYLGMAFLGGERPRMNSDLDPYEFLILRQRNREKAEMHACASYPTGPASCLSELSLYEQKPESIQAGG